jgi:hypothetical protein
VDRRRTLLLAVLAAAVAVAGLFTPAAPAARTVAALVPAAPLAPAQTGDGDITPGVLMLSPVGDGTTSACTAAFVFAGSGATYLGYAAHCAAGGEATGLSGCAESTLPVGTEVTIVTDDESRTVGRLAYTSWGTMQERGETDETLCTLNDFALVELDPADADRVDPTVPVLGGPTDLDTDGTAPGERVFSYQPQNGGRAVKEGRSLGAAPSGLAHRVDTSPPGRPGDSGSGYLDSRGAAFGVLSTLFLDGSRTNGVTDLAHALTYAGRFGGIGTVSLVLGTEPFSPSA